MFSILNCKLQFYGSFKPYAYFQVLKGLRSLVNFSQFVPLEPKSYFQLSIQCFYHSEKTFYLLGENMFVFSMYLLNWVTYENLCNIKYLHIWSLNYTRCWSYNGVDMALALIRLRFQEGKLTFSREGVADIYVTLECTSLANFPAAGAPQ